MNKDKLQKLFALAANNPNPHEASVAALKFVQALQKKQPVTITFGHSETYTKEQTQIIANDAYNTGYKRGYNQGLNERNQSQQHYYITNSETNATISQMQSGNTIRFGRYRR